MTSLKSKDVGRSVRRCMDLADIEHDMVIVKALALFADELRTLVIRESIDNICSECLSRLIAMRNELENVHKEF